MGKRWSRGWSSSDSQSVRGLDAALMGSGVEHAHVSLRTAQEGGNAVGRRWAEQVGEDRYAVFEEVLREIVAATNAR